MAEESDGVKTLGAQADGVNLQLEIQIADWKVKKLLTRTNGSETDFGVLGKMMVMQSALPNVDGDFAVRPNR